MQLQGLVVTAITVKVKTRRCRGGGGIVPIGGGGRSRLYRLDHRVHGKVRSGHRHVGGATATAASKPRAFSNDSIATFGGLNKKKKRTGWSFRIVTKPYVEKFPAGRPAFTELVAAGFSERASDRNEKTIRREKRFRTSSRIRYNIVECRITRVVNVATETRPATDAIARASATDYAFYTEKKKKKEKNHRLSAPKFSRVPVYVISRARTLTFAHLLQSTRAAKVPCLFKCCSVRFDLFKRHRWNRFYASCDAYCVQDAPQAQAFVFSHYAKNYFFFCYDLLYLGGFIGPVPPPSRTV